MIGALFRLGFRQSIVSACLAVGSILAAAIILLRLVPPSSERTVLIPGLAAIFLMWSGFLAGARLFSREFKERHVLLVQVIPLARPLAWAGLFLGGLAAGLSSLALLVVVHPAIGVLGNSTVRTDDVDSPALVAVPLLLYLCFFAAGTCYGLLLSGTAVHAVGLLATAAVVGEAFLLAVTLRGDPLSRDVPPVQRDTLIDPTNLPGLGELSVVSVLSLALYATLSAWFYSRGELVLARRRWRNVAWALMAHLVFFEALEGLSAARVLLAPLIVDRSEDSVSVSPDGRHLSVIERRAGFPRFCRVQIVEIATGRLIASRGIADLRQLAWSGDTLVASLAHGVGLHRPPFPRRPSDTVLLLSKDLRDLRRERLAPGMIVERLLARGNEVLVSGRLGPIGRLLTLRPGGGPPASIIEAGQGSLDMAPLDDGPVAVFGFGEEGRPRAWLVNPAAREIPVFGNSASLHTAAVIGPGVYAGPAIAEEMRRRFPWPSRAGYPSPPAPHYVFWSFGERRGWVFALVAKPVTATLDVFALGPGEDGWRSVLRNLPTPRTLEPWEHWFYREPFCVWGPGGLQLCPDGRVAWSEGDRRVVVLDVVSGQQRVFKADSFWLEVVSRGSGTLIVVRHGRGLDQDSHYLWRPGAPAPVELSSGPTLPNVVVGVGDGLAYSDYRLDPQPLEQLGRDRRHVFQDIMRFGVFVLQPGAGERRLWPVLEGHGSP